MTKWTTVFDILCPLWLRPTLYVIRVSWCIMGSIDTTNVQNGVCISFSQNACRLADFYNRVLVSSVFKRGDHAEKRDFPKLFHWDEPCTPKEAMQQTVCWIGSFGVTMHTIRLDQSTRPVPPSKAIQILNIFSLAGESDRKHGQAKNATV